MEAVKRNVNAVENTPDELQKDAKNDIEAITKNGWPVTHASNRLQTEKEFSIVAKNCCTENVLGLRRVI